MGEAGLAANGLKVQLVPWSPTITAATSARPKRRASTVVGLVRAGVFIIQGVRGKAWKCEPEITGNGS